MKKPSPYVDLRFKKILNTRSNYLALFQYFDDSFVDMPTDNSMLTISGFSYSGLSQPDLYSYQLFGKSFVNVNIYTDVLDYREVKNNCFFEIRDYLKILELNVFWKVGFNYLLAIQNSLAHCNTAYLRLQLSGEYRENYFKNFKVDKNFGLEIPISSIDLSFDVDDNE